MVKPLDLNRQSTLSAAQVRQIVDHAKKVVDSPDSPTEAKLGHLQQAIAQLRAEQQRDELDLTAANAIVKLNVAELEREATIAAAAARKERDGEFLGLGRLLPSEKETVAWDTFSYRREAQEDTARPFAAEVTANARAIGELATMGERLENAPTYEKLANQAMAKWRGVGSQGVLVAERHMGSQKVTDAYLSLTRLDRQFDSKSQPAKGLEVFSFAVAGEAAGSAGLEFARRQGVWSTDEGLRSWADTPKAVLALARALGTQESADAAASFDRLEGRWGDNGNGVRPAWGEGAKALLTLAHVVGGADKAREAMRFQWNEAKWGGPERQPWGDLPKAIVAMAHVIDAGKTKAAMASIVLSRTPENESARGLAALGHAIAGKERFAEAFQSLSTDRSLREVSAAMSETQRLLLATYEAFRKTPDTELPLERRTLDAVMLSLSALIEKA